MTARTLRSCAHPDCTEITRATSRLCRLHRPPVAVTADHTFVHITPSTRTLTHTAALKLADDIIDAIESSRETEQ